jgi:hypothetical protein
LISNTNSFEIHCNLCISLNIIMEYSFSYLLFLLSIIKNDFGIIRFTNGHGEKLLNIFLGFFPFKLTFDFRFGMTFMVTSKPLHNLIYIYIHNWNYKIILFLRQIYVERVTIFYYAFLSCVKFCFKITFLTLHESVWILYGQFFLDCLLSVECLAILWLYKIRWQNTFLVLSYVVFSFRLLRDEFSYVVLGCRGVSS